MIAQLFINRGVRADQPLASAAPYTLYCVTDEGDILERSNGTTWDAYSPQIKLSTVTLTNADILALPTTPIDLVAAPGAGFRVVLIQADLFIDTTAGAYSDVDTNSAYWYINNENEELWGSNYLANDTTAPAIAELTDFLTSGDVRQLTLVPFTKVRADDDWGNIAVTSAAVTGATDNVPLQLLASNPIGGNYAGGNAANTCIVTVWYAILPL